MAIYSNVLAWRIPGTGEPGGLLSLGSHRVGHDWSDLAVAAAEESGARTASQLLLSPILLFAWRVILGQLDVWGFLALSPPKFCCFLPRPITPSCSVLTPARAGPALDAKSSWLVSSPGRSQVCRGPIEFTRADGLGKALWGSSPFSCSDAGGSEHSLSPEVGTGWGWLFPFILYFMRGWRGVGGSSPRNSTHELLSLASLLLCMFWFEIWGD